MNRFAMPMKAEIRAGGRTNAERQLKIGRRLLVDIIGRRLNPESKSDELALLVIRCYQTLCELTGGDLERMDHWMNTENSHTGGIPVEQIKKEQGLRRVLEYLEAMSGSAE